ncbi:hypothetical protein CEXT_797261 [Caerostris extrusa]|uniref:Uncharacterized protein n=1 Tax=Caerostris extrusa TaxID=172846 RepID=A0AAV4REQ5_CAEEX|nr:hypothetical protein CEXT_797261 [Caerostris extrusa]
MPSLSHKNAITVPMNGSLNALLLPVSSMGYHRMPSLSHRQMLFHSTNEWIVKVDTTNSYVVFFFFFLHLHQWDTIDSTNAITVPQTNALPCSTNEWIFFFFLLNVDTTNSLPSSLNVVSVFVFVFWDTIDSTNAITVPMGNALQQVLPMNGSLNCNEHYVVFFFFLHLHQWDTIDSTNAITVHRQMLFRVPPTNGSLMLIQRTVTLSSSSSSSSSSCIFPPMG